MAFVQRLLNATFVIGQGNFGQSGGIGAAQVDLTGLRIRCRVLLAGGQAACNAEIAIYGMTLSLMNQLSTLGTNITRWRQNSITITASGDQPNPLAGTPLAGLLGAGAMSTVFTGTIINAWPDFTHPPDVPFYILAQTGLFESVKPTKALSFNGTTDVANILSGIANDLNLGFENNGVTVKLNNGYYAGSPWAQARQIVEDAGIEWNQGANGILAIWQPGQSRGGSVPLISSSTGMVGSPSYNSSGIILKTRYNPSIQFGGKIQVQSDLAAGASGTWVVYRVDHDLESVVPNGHWHSIVQCWQLGQGPTVP